MDYKHAHFAQQILHLLLHKSVTQNPTSHSFPPGGKNCLGGYYEIRSLSDSVSLRWNGRQWQRYYVVVPQWVLVVVVSCRVCTAVCFQYSSSKWLHCLTAGHEKTTTLIAGCKTLCINPSGEYLGLFIQSSPTVCGDVFCQSWFIRLVRPHLLLRRFTA